MKWAGFVLMAAAASGCGSIPADQDGTLQRIAATGEVRIGVASAAPLHRPRLLALADRSATAAGGRARMVEGATEALLLQLEAGRLDLVVGEFDAASPWYARVHLLPPMVRLTHGEGELEVTAAAPNGENGWIRLVEREARALADRP